MQSISIRFSKPEDEPIMVELGLTEDMGTLEGFQTTLVAQTEDGTIAGFCRVRILEGRAHVNPLVTAPAFRHQGIGAMLMQAASRQWGTLYFVARGYAIPFYRGIGSVEVPWEEIHIDVASDCDGCTLYEGCHPLPMKYTAE